MPTACGDVPAAAAYGFAVGCSSVVIRSPAVCYPLPGIAVDIVQAPGVRLFCANRMGAAAGKVFAMPGGVASLETVATGRAGAGRAGGQRALLLT